MDKKKLLRYSLCFGAVIVLLGLFGVIAFGVFGNIITDVDIGVFEFMKSIRNGFLTGFFIVITNLVHPISLAVITILCAIFIKQNKEYKYAMFLNLGLVAIINFGLKNIFVRARPDEIFRLVDASGYSFPSGHSMVSLAVGGFLIFLLNRTEIKTWVKIVLGALLSIGIGLVGLSRLYLGVHFLSDVVGGYLFSGAYLIIFILFMDKYFAQHKDETVISYKKHSFVASFKYATAGIYKAMIEERNLLIDFSATMIVVLFGVSCKISGIEWCIILLSCSIVIALELFNTAIEKLCDRITTDHDETIKLVKDISAGAVMVFAFATIVVGVIIFLPKLHIFTL